MPFISRVRIKNYKSIASCDVSLDALTILVGPNGSGKSNFLDALAFLTRALATSPAEAIDERGGVNEILRRVPDRAASFSISIDASIPWWPSPPEIEATYGFEIGLTKHGDLGWEVISEECTLRGDGSESNLSVKRGQGEVNDSSGQTRGVISAADRLLLPVAGIEGSFAQLYAGLNRMLFYNFNVDTLRRPRPSSSGSFLRSRGEGLGDALAALGDENIYYKSRIDAYMSAIVQDAVAIDPVMTSGYTTVALRAGINGNEFKFDALSMSDGTLRAAAVLVALFQKQSLDGRLPLVGIEEPETALHPAASGVLFDALTEASEHVQVIATTQSSDLLDREEIDFSMIRPVLMQDGLTVIGEVDDASREIAEAKLYTLGELMRGNQLSPDSSNASRPEET